jgi:hypothetical protein
MLRWALLLGWIIILGANGWMLQSGASRPFDGNPLYLARIVVSFTGLCFSLYGLCWVAGPKWPNGPFS